MLPRLRSREKEKNMWSIKTVIIYVNSLLDFVMKLF
jgi:hypothetical protein